MSSPEAPEYINIEVLEARNVTGLKNPNIRLKMGSQKFQAPALDTKNEILKWEAKTKFTLEKKTEKIEIKIGIYDKDSKISSAKLVIKNEKKPIKDKWFTLTGKSGGQNTEVRIRYSVGTPLKTRPSSRSLSTAGDYTESSSGRSSRRNSVRLSQSEDWENDSDASSARDPDDLFEGSDEDMSGTVKKKKKKPFKFITKPFKSIDEKVNPVTIGKLYVSILSATFDSEFSVDTGKKMVCECVFEKQDITTAPQPAKQITKWQENFVFTVKDLKSKFEFNAQYVIEGKEKMELIAVCKMKLEEIEPNVFVKKTFDLLQKKDKKRIAGLNLKFKYEPYEAIEEDDEQSEVDFENQSPIGRLTVDIADARNLCSTRKNNPPNPFVIARIDGQQFQTAHADSSADPTFDERFKYKIYNQDAKLRLTVWNKTKKSNDFMGIVLIPLSQISAGKKFDKYIPLQKLKMKNEVTGDIRVIASYKARDKKASPSRRSSKNNSSKEDDERSENESFSERSMDMSMSQDLDDVPSFRKPIRGELKVEITEAKGLFKKERDYFCKMAFDSDKNTTETIEGTTAPKWNKSYTLDVGDLQKSKIHVGIYTISKKKNAYVGKVSLPLSFLADRAHVDKWYNVKVKTSNWEKSDEVKKGDFAPQLRLRLDFEERLPEAFSPETEMSDNPPASLTYKIILIGDSAVGKSNLFLRFSENKFVKTLPNTVQSENTMKTYEVDGRIIRVVLYDTAGQERFKSMTRTYYRNAHGVFLVYDITSKRTFSKMSDWLHDVRNNCENEDLVVSLIGNKCDLDDQRQVSTEEGKNFAVKNEIAFLETSAKDKTNVNKAFQMVMNDIYQSSKEKGFGLLAKDEKDGEKITLDSQVIQPDDTGKTKNRRCCVIS
jgi:small GTP-binding protein